MSVGDKSPDGVQAMTASALEFGPQQGTAGPELYGAVTWSWIDPSLKPTDAPRVGDWPCVTLRWDVRQQRDALRLTEDW